MNRKEKKSVWVDEKEVDEFYTTKFLELLLQYDYVWSPNDQIALSINLAQDRKTQFLRDFSNYVEGIDERKASKALSKIKEIYNEEYYKLFSASKKIGQSSFYWFSVAHNLFRESMIKEYDEGKEHTRPILSQHFPAIGNLVDCKKFIFKDLLSSTSEDLTDEDPLSPRAEDFTEETPLSPTAEASANVESLALRIQTFTNSNSLSSRHEALADSNSLSSTDEAFIDSGSLSSSEVFADGDLSLITSEKMISRDFLSQEGRAFRITTSLSPAARRSLSPAARRSLSPAARRSLSPAARTTISPNARGSLSPEFKGTFSSSQESTSPVKQQKYNVVKASENTSSLKTVKERNQATRNSLPLVTRRYISPSARLSLSPVDRRSLSSISPTAITSLSPAFKRTLSSSQASTSPVKQQIRDIIGESENLNTSKIAKGRNRVSRKRSHKIPKRKLQPLIDLVKPTRCGNEITSCLTYSDVAWIIHEASHSNDNSSNIVEGASIQTSSPASEVKDHSNTYRFPPETLSRKEKSASRPSSLCPYITGYSNMPGSCHQGTETADSCDLNNSEARSIAQSAASQTIQDVNRRSEFAVTRAVRGVDSNRIFANRATSLLESLPPRLALECEAFILHFLHETLERK